MISAVMISKTFLGRNSKVKEYNQELEVKEFLKCHLLFDVGKSKDTSKH